MNSKTLRRLTLLTSLILVMLPALTRAEYSRRSPVVEAVEKVRGAVVNINTASIRQGIMQLRDFGFFEDFSPFYMRQNYRSQSLGTGVIVSADGYVITNAHVVQEPIEIQIVLPNGETVDARYVGADPRVDVAVLKISGDKKTFPFIPLKNHDDLMIGETVIAVGNPYGLQNTVTTGVVSAVDRKLKTDERTEFAGIIQTDAAINPGNSGGPLVDINAELVGISVAVQAGAENIGFAIPVAKVLRAFNELVRGSVGLQESLGLEVQNIIEPLARHLGLANTNGVVIVELAQDLAGGASGLQVGDVITAVNGKPVANVGDFSQLLEALDTENLKELPITVKRAKEEKTIVVQGDKLTNRSGRKRTTAWRGMNVIAMDSALARRLGVKLSDGVVLESVKPKSQAAAAELRAGDLILQIGKERITSIADFQKVVEAMESFDTVEILIHRGNAEYVATLKK